jgi:hypothetical protein
MYPGLSLPLPGCDIACAQTILTVLVLTLIAWGHGLLLRLHRLDLVQANGMWSSLVLAELDSVQVSLRLRSVCGVCVPVFDIMRTVVPGTGIKTVSRMPIGSGEVSWTRITLGPYCVASLSKVRIAVMRSGVVRGDVLTSSVRDDISWAANIRPCLMLKDRIGRVPLGIALRLSNRCDAIFNCATACARQMNLACVSQMALGLLMSDAAIFGRAIVQLACTKATRPEQVGIVIGIYDSSRGPRVENASISVDVARRGVIIPITLILMRICLGLGIHTRVLRKVPLRIP